MFCTNCGKQLEEGSKFCPGCGTPVAQGYQDPSGHPSAEERPAAQEQQHARTHSKRLSVETPPIICVNLRKQMPVKKQNSTGLPFSSAPFSASTESAEDSLKSIFFFQ